MKKIITVTTIVLLLIFTGCSKETLDCEKWYIEDDGECVFEDTGKYTISSEGAVNLENLAYKEYLNSENPVVTILVKDMGEIQLELFPEIAPMSVSNFIEYINNGNYKGNSFHRVIEGFMIQGGQLTTPSCSIEGEMLGNNIYNPLSHTRGVLSMARVGGNYNSGTSQFFIVQDDSVFLDYEYASFGGVISGFNIVDFIAKMQSSSSDAPTEEITILDIKVDLKGKTYDSRVCSSEYVDKPITIAVPEEKTIDLETLPYSEYLSDQNPIITIEFEALGDMKLQLFPNLAPNTVNNFISYINNNDFEDNQIHRLITDFVIQGGAVNNTTCEIEGEMTGNGIVNPLKHYKGVISMARMSYSYDTATSQFFIMLDDVASLDEEYATFGGVISGFNILDFLNDKQKPNTQEPAFGIVITNITIDLNGYVPNSPICTD